MLSQLVIHGLTTTLVAPLAAALPLAAPPHVRLPQSFERAAMQARFDPSLDGLRAGTVVAPAAFDARARAELEVAERNSSSLLDMRAGFAPSNSEWTWIAIGAGVVLLLVLL